MMGTGEETMTKLRRRDLLGLLASGLVLRGLPATAQERQALIEGAKKEGAMAFATSISAAGFPRFMDAFKAKYPFLDVASGYYSAPTGRVLARVGAELNSGSLTF